MVIGRVTQQKNESARTTGTFGRIKFQKQQSQWQKQLIQDPLGVDKMIQGATQLQRRRDTQKEFGKAGTILSPSEQNLTRKISRIAPTQYTKSLVKRSAPYIKAATETYNQYQEQQEQKTEEQKLREFPSVVGRVGMAFVKGINTAAVRFLKSGSEIAAGRVRTQELADSPFVAGFGASITGREEKDKLLTFQQIGENVHRDALAQGASQEEARRATTIAVVGSLFAEGPLFPGKGIPKNVAEFIAKSADAKAIESRLVKEFPDLLKKTTPQQRQAMSELLVRLERTQDVQTVLTRTDFALKGRVQASQEGIVPIRTTSPVAVTKPVSTQAELPTMPPKVDSPIADAQTTTQPEISTQLVAEARKYKSAEEFVEAQKAKPDFTPSKTFEPTPGETKFSTTRTVYTQEKSTGDVFRIDFVTNKKTGEITVEKYIRSADGTETITEGKKLSSLQERFETKDPEIIARRFSTGDETASQLVSSTVKTKSQLTDIYNRATGARTERKPSTRVNTKLEERVKEAPSFEEFYRRSGITREALDATAKNKGFTTAEEYFEATKAKQGVPEVKTPPMSETGSLEVAAQKQIGGEDTLRISEREEEKMTHALESVFADLKGVEIGDIKTNYTEADLENIQMQYVFAKEALMDDPAAALSKYVSKTGEFKGTLSEVGSRDGKGSKWQLSGDEIAADLGFKSSDDAREAFGKYRERRQKLAEYETELQEVRHAIRLAKQKDAFVGKEKHRLAKSFADNQQALTNIVKAAERAGFRRGVQKGAQAYNQLVRRNKDRRLQLTRIKKEFNLTDTEWAKIRRQPVTNKDGKVVHRDKDWREMDADVFAKYVEDVNKRAALQNDKNKEKVIIDALIQEKDLKKIENLQRAMEFPPVKDMSLKQLQEFGDVLAKTEASDTFLGPRMIQTVKNTDLGDVKTVGQARKQIEKQTNMPADEVEGWEPDNWLRDPTLAERDPLHKLFITEWAAKEVEMLSRKHALRKELEELAGAARKSRKRGLFDRLAPQDRLVVQWLQPFTTDYANGRKIITPDPSIRARAQEKMTPEELKYAQFLEKFFQHYYGIASKEATQRWTLMGVKHTNYKNIYFTHMPRGFFERWRDDGFLRATKIFWDKNVADQKVDFNAFGDRGEVLGYEKWLNRNITREGEGVNKDTGKLLYTQNTAKVAIAYFHAFERKILIDSMIPKIKLYEFLLGAQKQTPKSISNPEGTEQVNSALRDHINRWINNKKGQRSAMVYSQGSRMESSVDALRLFVAVQHLGVNVIAQVISGIGGEAATFAGAGIRGWARGHQRALTVQGRKLGDQHAGVIGEPAWNELASVTNEAGDTLRSGLFYLFGELAFRARRQMFLGMLSKQEFTTGQISPKRLGEVKLQIGKWHPFPEFRSVRGSTSEAKAAGMYTEWAVPIIQTTYAVNLPRTIHLLRSAEPDKYKQFIRSKEFQELFRTAIAGSALAGVAYLLLAPDEGDQSNLGYATRKAAQEIGTTIQAVSLFGVPIPGAIMIGYLEQLREALGMMIMMEQYKSSGPGYKEGDLKGPHALYRALVPSGVRRTREMIFGQPETPLKTRDDIREELREKLNSGELSREAAKVWLSKELKNLEAAEKRRRLEMSKDEYREDLRTRLEADEITRDEAKEELTDYLEEQKKYAPESFKNTGDADFIGKIKIAAKGLGTDPVTAFQVIFTGEEIRRMDNGEIILHRGKTDDSIGQRDFSLEKRRERGASAGLELDHVIPLQLGGDNSDGNLRLIPEKEHDEYTPVGNYLGRMLRAGSIDAKKAQQLIRDLKDGKLTAEEVYEAVE